MGSFTQEEPPHETDGRLAEYLSRMMTLINIAMGQNSQLVKHSTLPGKPSVGKLYFFTRTIGTTIPAEGVYVYSSAGYEQLITVSPTGTYVRKDTAGTEIMGADLVVGDQTASGISGGEIGITKPPTTNLTDNPTIDVQGDIFRMLTKPYGVQKTLEFPSVSATVLTSLDVEQGTGNGFDADTVDTIHADQFVRNDVTAKQTISSDFVITDQYDTPTLFLESATIGGTSTLALSDSSQNRMLMFYENTSGVGKIRTMNSSGIQSTLEFKGDGNVAVDGATPTDDDDLTRKDYVDGKFSAGVTGTFANPTSITIVDGLITAIS